MPEDTVGRVEQRLEDLSKELLPLIKANQHSIDKSGEGREEIVTRMGEIASEQTRLRDIIAGLEVEVQGKSEKADERKSLTQRFVEHDAYKEFMSARKRQDRYCADIGRLWQRRRPSWERKDEDISAASLIVPWYRPDIVELARPMPRCQFCAPWSKCSPRRKRTSSRLIENPANASQSRL
jgi:hypothetical protein